MSDLLNATYRRNGDGQNARATMTAIYCMVTAQALVKAHWITRRKNPREVPMV
jgi:predicted cupin superfamily sugar epimerase